MVQLLGHRQTKGPGTALLSLPSPRHISTLQLTTQVSVFPTSRLKTLHYNSDSCCEAAGFFTPSAWNTPACPALIADTPVTGSPRRRSGHSPGATRSRLSECPIHALRAT